MRSIDEAALYLTAFLLLIKVTTSCDAPVDVSGATYSPVKTDYADGETVDYTCTTGFEQASGSLTLTCNNSTGQWEGTLLICTIVTCAAENIANAAKIPDQETYNYNVEVVYSCYIGYEHSSGDLSRNCTASGSWSGTAPVCSVVTCAAPASVLNASSSLDQAIYDYNTTITYTCDMGFEHTSGDVTRTCTANALWSGVAPVCSKVTCPAPASVPNSFRVPDQVSYDYATNIVYTCELGYYHSGGDANRTCTSKGSWSGAAPACTLVTCPAPASVPNSFRVPDQVSYDYATNIVYTCELGYYHSGGDANRTCTSNGSWSGAAPACTQVTCPAPASVPNSFRVPDQVSYDYATNIVYTCELGYYHSGGDANRTCTSNGSWSGAAPDCTQVTCPAPASVPNSFRVPDQVSYDYATNIVYTCELGYYHSGGDANRTCTSNGSWSGAAPACTLVTCAAPASVPNSFSFPDQATFDYNVTITYTCDTGFQHTIGDIIRTCTASGLWSGIAPVCSTITCAEEVIPNIYKSPDLTSYAFNDTVTYACATGYEHASGTLERTCTAIDTWSGTAPVCTIVTCAAVNVPDASKSPDQTSYDYSTNVTYTCNEGYEQTSGDMTRTCTANGTWSGTAPICTIVTCTGEDIVYSSKSPNQTEYDYNTDVVYTCDVGYEQTGGDMTRKCTASRTWSGTAPTCSLVTCAEVVLAHSTKTPDFATYNYSTIVDYTCDIGYENTGGSLTRMCTASGTWTGAAPICSIKTCAKISVDHASAAPDQPTYNYNTDVTYSCDLAYNHTDGDLGRTCNASAEWTGTLPTCTVAACIEEPGVKSTFTPTSPSTLHNFDVVVTYTCDTGYNHSTGDLVRTCQNTGQWSGTAPVCTIVTCDHPPPVENTTETSTVQAEYDYLTDITYECVLAYNYSGGNLVQTCQEDGTWSGQSPICLVAACIQEGADNSTFTPDSPTTLHNFGDVLTYTCNMGYNHSTGDLERTCQNTGEWSGELPVCPIVTCSQPPVPSFTSISPVQTEYIYLSVLTYTCDLGYNRTAGDETRTCDENARWTGVEADCTLVTCKPPPVVPHSMYYPDIPVYNYTDAVNFTCDLGYYYLSGDMTRSCNEHAQWTGTTPVCTIVQCPKVDEPHATRSPNTNFYDYNTSVEYSCVIGYNMTGGDAVRECNYTGTWTNTPPVCTIVECDPPDDVMYATWLPMKSPYVYQDTLTYTCNLGYEITVGDATRTCDHTGHWTNVAPNCTVVHCQPPADGTFTTYTPDEAEYQWNDTVDYACIVGYNLFTGDLHRECQHDKTWSGMTPICIIITCDKVDIDHMTFDPPTLDTHDFGTTVVYSCDVGYNHSYGELEHTCTHTREWTGVFPNCTIITCDPPAPIAHTKYSPNNLTEHDWNTAVEYTCEADYHYVSGVNIATCNETGEFPPVDFDCSALHTLSVDPGEPAVTVINTTITTADIKFNFDGLCNVAVQVVPDGLAATLTSSGTVITVTVSERVDSDWNIYSVELLPTRLGRSWPTVSATVFYGLAIQGFQAWLDNSIDYIEVGKEYTFKVNVTQATDITLSWILENNVNITEVHDGLFSSTSTSHTYNDAGPYEVTVHMSNFISSESVTLPVYVLHNLDEVSFTVDSTLTSTIDPVVFNFILSSACQFPMGDVDFYIYFGDGSNISFHEKLNIPVAPLPYHYSYTHLYDTQGMYYVYAKVEHILGLKDFSVTINVWDSLDMLSLEIQGQTNNIYISNAAVTLEFKNYINAGFEYLIDYSDGSSEGSNGSDILYSVYALSAFEHFYTEPGVYEVSWKAWNGHFNKSHSFPIIVQNEIQDFQAWLRNEIVYIEVGQSYPFEANASHGTNMTVSWSLETTVNTTQFVSGEFTTATLSHSFSSPGTYEIIISVANLVSSDSETFMIHVLYSLECLQFGVDSTLANTTLEATFSFILPVSCSFPMGNVDFFIDYNHSAPISFMEGLNSTIGLPHSINKSHLFDTQGVYEVYATAENILGKRHFSLMVEVWDTLIPLRLEIKDHSGGNVFATNTTTTLEFVEVPNAGFEYFIDFGDGTTNSSNNSDILYELYGLSVFQHVYTEPEVYTVVWRAQNGHDSYNREETFSIIVQNEVQDFKAWLRNEVAYIEVGQSYTFEANASHGTNMTVSWSLETTVNTTQFITGEFTTAAISHSFNSPGTYEIIISVANLVSSDSETFMIHVLYSLKCLKFSVDSNLANTTLEATFSFILPVSCSFPMGNVEFFIDYNHSAPISFMEGLNSTIGLPHSINKSHLFDTQGVYEVYATAENILGKRHFSLMVEVWDTLIPLRLEIKDHSGGNVFATNTTTTLEFVEVPNAGFEYFIDFGDGTTNSSNNSDILYELYSLTVFEHVYTEPEVYTVVWRAENGHDPYNREETFTIIVQNEVQDFKAWLRNEVAYIEVGQSYTFEANASHGTNMTVSWSLETTVNTTQFITGEFTTAAISHSFNSPGTYEIIISVANLVSSDSETYMIHVLYSLECLQFGVDSNLANTTLEATFSFILPVSCSFPMGNVDFFIDYNHSAPISFMEGLNSTLGLPHFINKSHLFDTQGVYEVYATAENILGKRHFSLMVEVWDTLIPLRLEIKDHSGGNVFATNTTTTLEFVEVPNAGFEYFIDFGDGTTNSSNNSDILYELYSLTVFQHVYTQPEIYTVLWRAENGHDPYNREETFTIIVQNEVQDFQAWLNNSIKYLAVGDDYLFEASATQGTNISVAWNLEPNVTLNNTFPGEFSYASKTYRYDGPGEYTIIVIASNLVNSQTAYIYNISVIYRINGLSFSVDSQLGNTTHPNNFTFTFGLGTNLPMDLVGFTINYKYGTNVSESHMLGPSETLPYVLSYQQLFAIQGIYLVEGTAENILGQQSFLINMSIWDTLELLEFNFYQSNGKYITNTTTTLVFENVPNAGFEYIIDYGDGFSESSSSSEILYRLYNLTEFNHTYTKAGIYTIRWIAYNGYYRRDETFTVLIQNKVPSEGFSLEPINKKYPWVNLQEMDIPVNITLNETVPLPTNATCVFEPDDGKPQVTGLVYNESFFQHKHRYLKEGNFSSHLNCSNEVSWYIYSFSLCVQRYNASFLSVVFEHLVPLNISDNVTVYFHIDNGGFALIPLQVQLDWNFGDGSTSSPVPYNTPMYTHDYSARGDYTVTIYVTALNTSTTSTLVYDLRLGIMHFEYNYDIGFINTTEIIYTMYGVLGVDTTYTLDFADGTPNGLCSSADYSGCLVKHIFPYWGERTVQVVASNSTFIEIDEVFMTIDNPIVNLTLNVVRSVAIPDGKVDVTLRIEEYSPVLPFLNCNVSMGDPIKRDPFTDIQNVTFHTPFFFDFTYIALGRVPIEATCWNLINSTKLMTEIVVTNKDFLFTGTFDRQFSQKDTPLRLSSMKDNEITNRLYVLASLAQKTRINVWTVENMTEDYPGRHSIIFPRGYLKDGTYYVDLTVGFVEEPQNKITEPTYLDFISPPPHAEIVGGRRRISTSGDILVDAKTLSYDLVFTESAALALTFIWDCKSFTGASFSAVIAAHNAGNSSYQSCTVTPVSSGMVIVKTVTGRWYAITVTIENNRTLASSFTQYIQISTTQDLKIICHINCLSKIAVTSNLQLVPALSNNGKATFKWHLQKKVGTNYGSYIDLDPITETGSTKPSLTIRTNSLDAGSWYLVSLDMVKDGTFYGPAYYEFVTNRPPRGGSCRVVPYDEYLIPESTELVNSSVTTSTIYSSVANKREYNLTCKDWLDEGFTEDTWTEDEPLFYFFFLQYGDQEQRQILYFDPGATSNMVTFQIGDVQDGYKATVVLRITDVFGDYTELRYSVISTPYLTTDQLLSMTDKVLLKTVEERFSEFDEELLKANQSYDYRTLARKIQGIASVYNAIVLNTSASITLTPDDLLTLGYKRTEDGKLIKWAEYWSLIVEVVDTSAQDYLIHMGEKYVQMLHHSITTWPSDRRISIVAIETMSRALNATLARVDYSNVTAPIKASECADILARHLASYMDDRTFPNTEDIYYAAIALRDLIRNVLAALQTVLTPNLPVDPTVEEMRNYLLYIQVFKSEVAGTAPLSLQEQTFLAQKQLQKYYVAKHIKSEASKEALPYLMAALQNIMEMFSRMIQIGQREMYLENDFIYISAEINPAYELFGTTVERPHASIVLDSLIETHPEDYNASAVTVKTAIFKHNPYFWGEWADRISSYVATFEFERAILIGDTIKFKLENAVVPDCIDKTPTYAEDDPNKMIYILFDRMYGDDDILLFIRPNATELVYQAYFNKDEKPSIEGKQYIYSQEINVDKWTYEDGYKVKISATEFSTTGKIWIALRPLLENSVDLSLLKKPFCANVTSVNCLAWIKDSADNYYWDRYICKVSRESSRTETVCECDNPGPGKTLTVGTTFYVPPNKIDFFAVFVDTDPLGNSPVLGTIIAVFIAFVLFVPWAWRADLKDKYKWSYALLVDNDIADSYFYLLRVYTGIRHGSGTKSNVGFVLVGEDGDTGIRIMDDDSHVGFEAGSVRNFVLSTRQRLGDVVCLRIWHDDSGGNESAWFLNKILVTDLQTGKRYIFKCNQWLDYDHGDQRVDRALTAQTADDTRTIYEMAPYTAAEHHLWMSVFIRPLNSNFTRVQRLACLLGILYLTMIVCTLILKTPDEVEGMSSVVVGPFRFSMENFFTAFISVAVVSPIIMIVAFLFKNAESEEVETEYLSCCRKGYRNVNNMLKMDKSVLGTDYIPPTHFVVRHFHFLPHFCVYVGWALLIMCVGMATWLLMLFSADWKQEKSETWMTTIFCAILLSVFVVETIKIGLIIIVVALLCKKAYDPPEPYIDVDRLKEISKKNSHFLTKGPFYMNYLHQPPLPNQETLEENRRKRIRNHQIVKILYQSILFSGVLYIVITISLESRDPKSYYFKSHVEDMMAFDTVKDLDTYVSWLNGTFVEEFFFSKYFGTEYNDGTYKGFTRDIANLRVGPARLRQLRIKRDDCLGPLSDYIPNCYNSYVDSKVETVDYCIGWKDMPCAVSEKADFFTSAAWLYNSSDEVWGFPTMAEYYTYMGGGYFMKLDVNKDVSLRIFTELLNQGWIDRQTRVVILEFTVYNINANLFAYAKYAAEFPEVGGVLPYTDIQVFRLYTNSSTVLLLQFFFVLLVLTATVYMFYEICSSGKTYFRAIWNWLDMLALIMSYSTIAIFIVKQNILEKTINMFHQDKNAYVSFENLAFYDFFSNTTLSILVFLLLVRISRIFGYSGKINEMAAVITSSAGDLAGFCVIFSVTYFAYVQLGTMLFGSGSSKYRDLFHTYGTLTEAIVGKNRLANILTSKPMLAEFYYFTFVLFVLLTLATMAAAILNFSISNVKKESKQISAPNIIEVIFDKIGAFITRLTEDGNNDGKGSRHQQRRRSSSSELRDILSDFKHFLRDVKLQSKEKYRVLTPEQK